MKIVQKLPKEIEILDVVKLHTNLQIAAGKDLRVETEFNINK